MLSHRQYSHALRSKRRSGPGEAQSRELVNFIKKHAVLGANMNSFFWFLPVRTSEA
jgi:hypothetical protein